MGNSEEYNRQYYKEHKTEITIRRKNAYYGDESIREAVKERNKKHYESHKVVKFRKSEPFAAKDLKPYKDTFVVGLGPFCKKVGLSVSCVTRWHNTGVLPEPLYDDMSGRRMYSIEYADMVNRVLGPKKQRWNDDELRNKFNLEVGNG